MPAQRVNVLIALALVGATLVAWSPVLDNGFVNFDDELYVTDNRQVQAGLTAAGLRWAWTTLHPGYYQPLTWMSLQLDAQLYGLAPWGYHLTNLLLHAANAVLLFEALRRLTGAVWRSAAVAALFALHPLHVESVAWATERKDVLSTFFGLLALLAYQAYARRPHLGRYLLVAGALALGLLAKPMLATLPCVLLLLDYWPLRRWRPGASARLLAEKLPLLALAAAAGAVTVFAQNHAGALLPLARLPLDARLENALVGYLWYLKKTFWPSGLAPFYPHPGTTLPVWQVAGAGVVLLAVTLAALGQARRRPYLAVGWLWFLGMLLPVSGLLQAGEQPVADRFVYLPHVGLFILLCWGAHDLLAGWRLPRAVPALAGGAVLLACAVCTWLQVHRWHDSVTLLEYTLRVNPVNPVAHNNLGAAFLRQGRLDRAVRHFAAALEADPASARAHYNMGVALVRQGRPGEAIDHFAEALEVDPRFALAHYEWGVALASLGRPEEAILHFRAAVDLDPRITPAHHNWGVALLELGRRQEALPHFRKALELDSAFAPAHASLGVLLFEEGKLEEAEAHFRAVLRLAPRDAALHYQLGRTLARQQRWPEAEDSFRAAARLQPGFLRAHCGLAWALLHQGRGAAAEEQYREAFRINPRWPAEAIRQAWALATAPEARRRNGALAVELAEQACQATGGKDPAYLDTLAAAYAEAGRFDRAVATARRALGLTSSAGQAREIQGRLQRYEKGRAFRERHRR
jgi:tetratricopeptide (TPR) repeat protein